MRIDSGRWPCLLALLLGLTPMVLVSSRAQAQAPGTPTASASTGASAAAVERPPLLVQQSGTVTRAKLQGSLAPTRDLPCLRGDQIEASFTQPALVPGFDTDGTWASLLDTYGHCNSTR